MENWRDVAPELFGYLEKIGGSVTTVKPYVARRCGLGTPEQNIDHSVYRGEGVRVVLGFKGLNERVNLGGLERYENPPAIDYEGILPVVKGKKITFRRVHLTQTVEGRRDGWGKIFPFP